MQLVSIEDLIIITRSLSLNQSIKTRTFERAQSSILIMGSFHPIDHNPSPIYLAIPQDFKMICMSSLEQAKTPCTPLTLPSMLSQVVHVCPLTISSFTLELSNINFFPCVLQWTHTSSLQDTQKPHAYPLCFLSCIPFHYFFYY